jgi:nucleoid-associated protein EbfC
MFKGLAGMASMMGNLHQLPVKLEEINQQMRESRVTGASSCGHVTVVMNGLGELQSVDISSVLVAEGDAKPAAGPICQATNKAGAEAKRMYGEAMQAMARDMNLNLPGMDSLLARMTGGSGG